MRALLPVLLLGLALVPARAQTLELVDTHTFPGGLGGSDTWWYVAPDGTNYAIYGVRTGIAIVQVPSMQVITTVPGPEDFCSPYYWRDMRVLGHYALAVSECYGTNEGLMVIDLSGLPASATVANVHTNGVVSSHNMDVDEGTGYLYVLDSSGSGVHIIDATNLPALVNVHWLDLPDVHDVHARNDTLYVSEGFTGDFSIWDVSNKTSPQLLTRVSIPSGGYSHNIWPTDDGRYVLTTEETANRTIKVWDITDMSDVTLVGQFLAPNQLAHNVHVQGDYAFVSHYESGVVVADISDPANPVIVDQYDTYPQGEGPSFNGTWGVTLPGPDGYIYAGDMDGELTVLRWNPPAAAVVPELDPVSPPVVVPPAGGSFSYTARVTNGDDAPHAFDAWITATLPNGSPYGPVAGPLSVTLPAGGSAQRTLRLRVPAAAPPGTYTLTLNVGEYPSGVEASDAFTFEKGAAGAAVAARAEGPVELTSEGAFFDAEAVVAPAASAVTSPGRLAVYPNPSGGRSTVGFALEASSSVRLSVLDALGREVALLAEGRLGAGEHAYAFEGHDLPAGLYLARLEVGGRVATHRFSIVR